SAFASAFDVDLASALDSRGPLRSGGAGGQDPQGAAQGCAAFSAGAGCPLGKSRRLRGPDAKRRARRRGVLSLRQVSLHKQRKVARAVTARKLLILVSVNRQADKTRPADCGEEQVGDVAPTYGGFCGTGRRASRGRSPDLRRSQLLWQAVKWLPIGLPQTGEMPARLTPPRRLRPAAAPIAPAGSPRTTPPAAASTRPRTSNRTPGAC